MKKVLTEKEKSEYTFIIRLISCLFGNRQNVSVPDDLDWQSVFACSKKNSISNMISYAAKYLGIPMPADAQRVFSSERKFSLMKDASQFAATQKLLSAFEREGVDNLLVKGQFIKDTYPQPDYRITCDVDIHLRQPDLKKAEEIANSLGFKTIFSSDILAIVRQEPFVEFELHADNGEFADTTFSDDLFLSAKLTGGTAHCYRFPLEQHYIYIAEHYAKHYRDLSGMGLRMVMDMYCLHRFYKDRLDFSYIDKRLKRSGIDRFHRMLIEKGRAYFEGNFSGEFDSVDIFILSNGIMGNREVYTYNLKRRSDTNDGEKRTYFFRKVCPKPKLMKHYYPVLNEHPVLLPCMWVYRWGDILFGKSRKTHLENIKYLKQYSSTGEQEYLKNIMIESGFDL